MRRLPIPLAVTLALGCNGLPDFDPENVEDGFVVPEGKEDNYLSVAAKEYVFEGRATVKVEEGAGEARARELISLRHIAIAWFLNQYLIEKDHEESNASYGGFGAMVKAGDYEDLDIVERDGGTYEFTFAQLVAGKTNLLRALPLVDGRLEVEVGLPTNEEMAELETNHEWYRQAPWDSWDPSQVGPDRKETLTFTVREETRSSDAWWDFGRLLDDGKLTIDVHFGWDYHDAYHLVHSRALYGWLRGRGFRSPVSSFDAYTRTSGPLTATLSADGRSIAVEVRIFYGKPGTETDPDTDAGGRVLEEDMRESLRTRDVIVYSGHSGPFYGFALANWKKTEEGDLDDSEMRTVEMPADRGQIVVAEGCDTFMIGPAFLQNVNKDGRNVDVVTTTSFSNASSSATVEIFLARLLEKDSQGRHRPRTLTSLLTQLEEVAGWGFHVMYGVHGVDDNPHLHPYARIDRLCQRCSRNSDCGGVGNGCIGVGSEGRFCSAACTDDSGCPSGYSCKRVASSSTSTIYGSMCVPTDLSCQ